MISERFVKAIRPYIGGERNGLALQMINGDGLRQEQKG